MEPTHRRFADLEIHLRMLADSGRLEAYSAALEAVVEPGALVVDLGCGTGVLGLLALKAGAGRVIAVDRHPAILELATALAEANGFSDRFETVCCDLAQFLHHPRTPRGEVDVIVSELLGNFGIGETSMAMLSLLHRVLLKPGGRAVPAALELFTAPIAAPQRSAELSLDGLRDLGLVVDPLVTMNHCRPAVFRTPTSAPVVIAQRVARLDLLEEIASPIELCSHQALHAGQRIDGLLGFFIAELAPGVILSNAPGIESHWHQTFFPLPEPLIVRDDDESLEIQIRLDELGSNLPVWSWRVTHLSEGGATLSEQRIDGLDGRLVDAHRLRRRMGRTRIARTDQGELARELLSRAESVSGRELLDGLPKVANELLERLLELGDLDEGMD